MFIPYPIHASRPPESPASGVQEQGAGRTGCTLGHFKPLLCLCKTIQVEPAVKDPQGLTHTPPSLLSSHGGERTLGSEGPGKIFPQVEGY
jgi:hypothetical protein